jgi:hypothetical protein
MLLKVWVLWDPLYRLSWEHNLDEIKVLLKTYCAGLCKKPCIVMHLVKQIDRPLWQSVVKWSLTLQASV